MNAVSLQVSVLTSQYQKGIVTTYSFIV